MSKENMGQRQPWKKGQRRSISRFLHSRTAYAGSITDLLGCFCVASCGEWSVILNSASKRECFLWSSTSYQKVQLPQVPKKFSRNSKCILSAPPTQPQCAVLFFSKEMPHILGCKIGDTHWTNWPYSCDPEFVYPNAISCNGKIYVLHYRGLLFEIVLQLKGLRMQLTDLQAPVVVAEKQHLVESCGEVFLVQRFSVSRLEVFRMDFSRNERVKIQSLDESLSVSLHGPNSGALFFSYDGPVPVLRHNPTYEQLKEEEEEEEEEINDTMEVSKVEDDEAEKSIFWELPIDLQKSIAECVCRTGLYELPCCL